MTIGPLVTFIVGLFGVELVLVGAAELEAAVDGAELGAAELGAVVGA